MKKSCLWLLVSVLFVGLVAATGCGDDESFDSSDIAIVNHTATLSGTSVIWSITLSSVADSDADVRTFIKLKVQGSTTYFYNSPEHAEKLAKKTTKTFSYVDTGVAVPPGAAAVMYEVGFSATPD